MKNFFLIEKCLFALFAGIVLTVGQAHAIQFDGFLTAGASIHDEKNNNRYIGSLGDRGVLEDLSFETDSRFGLQISSDVSENMSVVAQILGTGVNGNFDAIVEWGYVDYAFNDTINLRAGKIKQPVYLVNDYVEVGYAYPWIRPPVELYYLNNPLNTVNGMELLISFPVGDGQLSFQPYIGSNRDDIPNTSGTGFFEAENIVGIDITYSGRGVTVHASNFKCEVKLFGALVNQPTLFGFNVDVDLTGTGDCEVTSAGFNIDISDVVVYAEWQDRTTTSTLSRPFGDTEAWYTTLGYRIGKWLPHITYANTEGKASTVTPGAASCAISTAPITGPGVGGCITPFGQVPPGTALFNFPIPIQSSITAGLRYEINDSAALKIEHSIVDVETDPTKTSVNPLNINYGLFDTDFTKPSPTEKVGITSIALDLIF